MRGSSRRGAPSGRAYSRFPAAQPVACDLNEIVKLDKRWTAWLVSTFVLSCQSLPTVEVDPGQFKTRHCNLIDTAAEWDSLVKRLLIATQSAAAESVELLVADTGCGISSGDKEKLFLPYFSTKGRGTGLGLAIVNHILSEHRARIRVEENRPTGARFYVEVPVAVIAEIPFDSGVRA